MQYTIESYRQRYLEFFSNEVFLLDDKVTELLNFPQVEKIREAYKTAIQSDPRAYIPLWQEGELLLLTPLEFSRRKLGPPHCMDL
jgi:hypothetical protein